MNVRLLLIDPQNDFCLPGAPLYVNGAEKDMDRVAQMINRLGDKINWITVSLDSHQVFDIAHPAYWVDADGNNPAPFTPISAGDVESGKWQPSVANLFERSLSYLRELEECGRYGHLVWPVHCKTGTPGHNIEARVADALAEWGAKANALDVIFKGMNPYTEHFSALRAEVPDVDDASTHTNTKLLRDILDADIVGIAGEASSHCVASTVRDIVDSMAARGYKEIAGQMYFIRDASSYVAGLPDDFGRQMEAQFLQEMTAKGMKVTTTKDFLS